MVDIAVFSAAFLVLFACFAYIRALMHAFVPNRLEVCRLNQARVESALRQSDEMKAITVSASVPQR